MEFEDALALLTREFGAVVRITLMAARMTPRAGAELKAVLAAHPGLHPVELRLLNGVETATLLRLPVTVEPAGAKAALEEHFGRWAL